MVIVRMNVTGMTLRTSFQLALQAITTQWNLRTVISNCFIECVQIAIVILLESSSSNLHMKKNLHMSNSHESISQCCRITYTEMKAHQGVTALFPELFQLATYPLTRRMHITEQA